MNRDTPQQRKDGGRTVKIVSEGGAYIRDKAGRNEILHIVYRRCDGKDELHYRPRKNRRRILFIATPQTKNEIKLASKSSQGELIVLNSNKSSLIRDRDERAAWRRIDLSSNWSSVEQKSVNSHASNCPASNSLKTEFEGYHIGR